MVPTPKQARQLLKMTAGLSLTLDYGHFTYQGISDRTVEPLVKHASHFHARGGCKGGLQAAFTENTIDFKREHWGGRQSWRGRLRLLGEHGLLLLPPRLVMAIFQRLCMKHDMKHGAKA